MDNNKSSNNGIYFLTGIIFKLYSIITRIIGKAIMIIFFIYSPNLLYFNL